MAEYVTLNDAMDADDELAEARIRYRLLSEAFEEMPQLRSQLNPQLERSKVEIARLKALTTGSSGRSVESGKVVDFDAARFQKSG